MSELVDEPTDAEIIRTAIETHMRGVHTSLPAVVVEYDNDTQLVTARPTVQAESPTGELYDLPPVTAPVLFPRGGGYILSFPLEAGDHVLLQFSEEDWSTWYDTGDIEPPNIRRRHGLHAFAIPGAFPRAKESAEARDNRLVIGEEGGITINVDGSSIRLGSNGASDFVALASLVLSELDDIRTQFDSHIHTTTATVAATSTPGVISAPTSLMGSAGSVAATKVKAE